MKKLAVLISPEIKSAYFHDYIDVAKEEIRLVLGQPVLKHKSIGSMEFFDIELGPEATPFLSRLSCFHGAFEYTASGDLSPLSLEDDLHLHESIVFGSKFKGKTNERLSQMLLNIGMALTPEPQPKVLDPMCGRATTLLWAMRYGLRAKGIEQDPKALQDVLQICKKWKKVHDEKLSFKQGHVGKKQKSLEGSFLEIKSPDSHIKMVTGDSQNCHSLLAKESFDIIASDLPYGIQHHTSHKTINPQKSLEACIPLWAELLRPGGAMVLSYNLYQPKREVMVNLIAECGLTQIPLSAQHRMSESIVRDIVVFQK